MFSSTVQTAWSSLSCLCEGVAMNQWEGGDKGVPPSKELLWGEGEVHRLGDYLELSTTLLHVTSFTLRAVCVLC